MKKHVKFKSRERESSLELYPLRGYLLKVYVSSAGGTPWGEVMMRSVGWDRWDWEMGSDAMRKKNSPI